MGLEGDAGIDGLQILSELGGQLLERGHATLIADTREDEQMEALAIQIAIEGAEMCLDSEEMMVGIDSRPITNVDHRLEATTILERSNGGIDARRGNLAQ